MAYNFLFEFVVVMNDCKNIIKCNVLYFQFLEVHKN